MPIHIDMAMFVMLHPNDKTFFRPVVGMAFDKEPGLDFSKAGLFFQFCFRLTGGDASTDCTTRVELFDSDERFLAKSGDAKPPLKHSPYDGAVHGRVIHDLKGFFAINYGVYEARIYLNNQLVTQTTILVERPARGF